MPTSSDPPRQIQIGIHPQLRGLAVEGRAVAVRLLAYFCGVGMLALIAADLVSTAAPEAPQGETATVAPAWSRASRPDRAFALNLQDFANKPESYETFRRPNGSRRDVLRWTGDGGQPIAQVVIERAGVTLALDPAADADLAPPELSTPREVEPAGRLQTKFGSVALWHVAGTLPGCLGFAREFEAPRLRISGWSCAAPARAGQQALLGCALDRLTLLSAGNNRELAALFARAELKRGACGTSPAAPADWLAEAAPPHLRGRL